MGDLLSRFSLAELRDELRLMRYGATCISRFDALDALAKEGYPKLYADWQKEFGWVKGLYARQRPLEVKYIYTLEEEIKKRGAKPARWKEPYFFRDYPKEIISPSEIVELRNLTEKEVIVGDVEEFLKRRR